MKTKKILISTAEGKYPILIGKNIGSKTGYLLKKNKIFSSKVLLVVDKKVPNRMVNKIKKSINQKKILFYLKSSEKNKSQDILKLRGQKSISFFWPFLHLIRTCRSRWEDCVVDEGCFGRRL